MKPHETNRIKEAQRNGLRIESKHLDLKNWTNILTPRNFEADSQIGWQFRIDPAELPQPPLETPEGWEEIFRFEKDGRFFGKARRRIGMMLSQAFLGSLFISLDFHARLNAPFRNPGRDLSRCLTADLKAVI